MPRTKKPKPAGEYQNLAIENGLWYFEVRLKDKSWMKLGGLSGEVSRADAEKFAQATAESWKKK